MSDGMRRELVYLSSHATNRYFIPNWGKYRSNIIPRARDNCVLTIHKSPQKTTKLRKKADKGNL